MDLFPFWQGMSVETATSSCVLQSGVITFVQRGRELKEFAFPPFPLPEFPDFDRDILCFLGLQCVALEGDPSCSETEC